jgi:hypothetical protein
MTPNSDLTDDTIREKGINVYREYGTYYGYPRCCIEAFVAPMYTEGHLPCYTTRSKEQLKVSDHGFIPCRVHALQILAKEITLAELILPSRQEPKPFPPFPEKRYRNTKQKSCSTRFVDDEAQPSRASYSQNHATRLCQEAQ